MLRIINKYSVKDVVQFLVLILIGLLTARALLTGGGSLGIIFRNILPVFLCLGIIMIINHHDIKRISFHGIAHGLSPTFPREPIKTSSIILILLTAITGIFFSIYFIEISLIYLFVIIALIFAYVRSFDFILVKKRILIVLFYLAAWPFLSFLEWESMKYEWFMLVISDLNISFNALGLLVVSSFFIFGNKSDVSLTQKEKNSIKVCALFVFIPLFYIFLSKDPTHSLVYYFMDLVLPFIFFVIIMISIKTKEDVIIFLFVLSSAIVLQQLFAIYFLSQREGMEVISTGLYKAAQSNISASLLLVVIPIQFVLSVYLSGWKRIVLLLTITFSIMIIFSSEWRTGIFVLSIGLFEYILLYRINWIKKTYFVLSGLVLLLSIFIYVYQYHPEAFQHNRAFETFTRIAEGEEWDSILSQRISIWNAAFSMIADNPIFGIGPDGWAQYIPKYARSFYFNRDIFGKIVRYYEYDPHNLYLLVYLNYGILGIMFYILILYRTSRTGFSSIVESISGFDRDVAVGLIISLSMWVISCFFTMRFFNHSDILSSLIFWSLVAATVKYNIHLDQRIA